MKKILIPLLLISSSAFAKVDFNLSKASEGGNADKTTFTNEKVLKAPDKFIGKEIIAPITRCLTSELKGININKEEINYDGVICYTDGNASIGLILNLKQREMAEQNKINKIKGKIVAVSSSYYNSIIVLPEKVN